jgi:hypothetical protein
MSIYSYRSTNDSVNWISITKHFKWVGDVWERYYKMILQGELTLL